MSSAVEAKTTETRIPSRSFTRLYVKAVFVGFRRSHNVQTPGTALLRIQGVSSKADTLFYLGKRVAFIYRASKPKNGSNFRVVWGRIARPHGQTGAVRATFRKNLPAKAMGASLRVMLYPSTL